MTRHDKTDALFNGVISWDYVTEYDDGDEITADEVGYIEYKED